jgi:hypothetical protein
MGRKKPGGKSGRIRPRVPKGEKEGIVAGFDGGASMPELAALFGHTGTTVQRILRQAGHETPRKGWHKRKYPFNERYFESIDSEEKAYWLGFLAADGCVSDVHTPGRRRKTLHLTLALPDAGHVAKLIRSLGSAQPVREYGHKANDGRTRYSAVAAFHSAALVEDLSRLGVEPRKSFTAQPWVGPDGLMRHYWRGVVDGDGGLRKQMREGRPEWEVYCCGSTPMMAAYAEFMRAAVGTATSPRPCYDGARIHAVGIGGTRMPQAVARLLYAGATVFLDRKKELADDLLRQDFPPDRWEHLTGESLLAEFERLGGSWHAVARELGMHAGLLVKIRRRLGIATERSGPRKSWAHVSNEELLSMKARLGQWKDVAAAMGMKHQKLSLLLLRRGLRGLRARPETGAQANG